VLGRALDPVAGLVTKRAPGLAIAPTPALQGAETDAVRN